MKMTYKPAKPTGKFFTSAALNQHCIGMDITIKEWISLQKKESDKQCLQPQGQQELDSLLQFSKLNMKRLK